MTIDESNASQPRKPWLKSRRLWRSGCLVAGLVVGVLALRIAWGMVAEHRLSDQIASYRAEGGPVTVEDFNAELDRVPDDENAALLYEKAFDLYVGTSQSGESLKNLVYEPEIFATKSAIWDELMEANRAALMLLHEAKNMPSVAWNERLEVGQSNNFQGWSQREISHLFWFASYYHFQNGDHYEAIEILRDFVRFNDAVDSHPTVISSLIARGCHNFAFSLVERYGSDLVVGADQKSAGLTPATREQIGKLIRELLDEQGPRKAAVRSYLGSRAETLMYVETSSILDIINSGSSVPIAKTPTKQVLNFMMQPSLVLDSVRQTKIDTAAVNAVSATTWPKASKFFLDSQVSPTLLTLLSRPLTVNAIWGSLSNQSLSVSTFFQTLSRRRMTALALAIRLYAVDHGHRPVDLVTLVPQYLPSLPPDPFANGVESFGYKPNANRPFLYSVGPDGKDNQGKIAHEPNGSRDLERSDIPFYLEPEPVTSSPGETNQDDEDVEDEQGDQAEHNASETQPNKR